VESFNGRFRDECLNENWFIDLADAREKIAEWRQDYSEVTEPSPSASKNAVPATLSDARGSSIPEPCA
jgi:putative transposase